MANIEQIPGELNISQMVKGEAFAFQTIHDGDITGDTFAASINNAGVAVPIGITAAYSSVTLKTTLTYTLTAVNSALLNLSVLTWHMTQTSGGVETPVDLGVLPDFGDVHDCVIELCQDTVYFWVNGDLRGKVDVPHTLFAPMGLAQCQYAIRTYNGAVIPSSAIKLQVSCMQVSNGGAALNRLWPTVRAGMGGGSYQIPSGAAAGQTANWTNSAAVVAAAGSNTAAPFTGLGGMFAINATVAADTDLNVIKYLVPTGSTLIIRGAWIDTANLVVAVATTATLLQWGIAVGSSADTLAGTEDAVGVKIRRAIPMGLQYLPVGAVVGQTFPRLDVNFDAPLVIHGGEYVSFFFRVLVGTATATEVYRGVIGVNGYFE